MFLAEKGIAVPLVSVDLAAGEQHRDAYLAINPRTGKMVCANLPFLD